MAGLSVPTLIEEALPVPVARMGVAVRPATPTKARKQFGGPCPPPPPPEVSPPPGAPPGGIAAAAVVPPPEAVAERVRARPKCDPRLVAAARELRDRYLDEVNRPGSGYALGSTGAKYDVTRAVAAALPGAGVLTIAA